MRPVRNPHLARLFSPGTTTGGSSRRRARRPSVEGLEDRTVLSSIAGHESWGIAVAHVATNARPAHAETAHPSAHRAHVGTTIATAAHPSTRTHHRRGHHTKAPAATPTPTPTPAPTPTPSPSPAPTTTALLSALEGPSTASNRSDPTVLTLTLNPLNLDLLGLQVELYGATTTSPVTVTVSAQPGSGELLGNLLTDVAGLINLQGVSNALDTVLNNVVSLANQATLSVNGQSASSTPTTTTQVLDAYIAPVNLNLMGAVVTTSPINLIIQAQSGTGLALGNIVTDLANLLNNPTGNVVHDVENGLNQLLSELNTQFPGLAPSLPTPTSTSSGAPAPGSFQLLSLTVPPIDLNLLGLILQTSTIQVNATSQSGDGNLLGNLINDLLNTVHASQSDLNTIDSDLDGVLDKVVGILNATTLSLPSGAVSSLSPTLQELASPTLIDTTGAAVPPEPVLNLAIATNSSQPPVDVNLLGVVVTTSDIQVQLLAQPGPGQILGNLVYNLSHLLDGGLLNVLGILDTLGV